MSNFHTGNSGSSNGANGSSGASGSNGNSFVSRRDIRANNATGALPVIGAGRGNGGYASFTGQPGYNSSFDFEAMLISLHELFEHDRQVASHQDARRCGICYLHFVVSELHYREEEGLYVCRDCDKAASKQQLPMVRRQQK